MSCKICGRSSCTQSFHSLDEQALLDQRESMPDDVHLLRRMVQEAAAEIIELKRELNDAKESRDNAVNLLIFNRQT